MKHLNITLPHGIYINPYELVPRATMDITFGNKQRKNMANVRYEFLTA